MTERDGGESTVRLDEFNEKLEHLLYSALLLSGLALAFVVVTMVLAGIVYMFYSIAMLFVQAG